MPSLYLYGDYVKNFRNALSTLARLKEESEEFEIFLSQTTERLADVGVALTQLLSSPLNRISQYKVQFEVLPFRIFQESNLSFL